MEEFYQEQSTWIDQGEDQIAFYDGMTGWRWYLYM